MDITENTKTARRIFKETRQELMDADQSVASAQLVYDRCIYGTADEETASVNLYNAEQHAVNCEMSYNSARGALVHCFGNGTEFWAK